MVSVKADLKKGTVLGSFTWKHNGQVSVSVLKREVVSPQACLSEARVALYHFS